MAKSFLVSYDLNKGEKSSDYQRLIKQIEAYGTWAKPLESTWFIVANSTASAVRDHLAAYIDSNDCLLVIEVTNDDWATRGISTEVTDWMKSNI